MNIKDVIAKEMNYIPDWINSTSQIDFMIWNKLSCCNDVLLRLVVDKVLSEKVLYSLIISFECYLYEIIEIITEDKELRFSAYIAYILDYILSLSLDYERFEVAANVKRFTDMYYSITENDENNNDEI